MVVFDTDILTIVQLESGPEFLSVERRMRAVGGAFYTSIISVEEQMRGWLAAISRATTVDADVFAYLRLLRLVEYFKDRPILPFDAPSAVRLRHLKAMKLRVGTMDLKIASIAIENNALLVTRNLADFAKIPGLRVEDWARPM